MSSSSTCATKSLWRPRGSGGPVQRVRVGFERPPTLKAVLAPSGACLLLCVAGGAIFLVLVFVTSRDLASFQGLQPLERTLVAAGPHAVDACLNVHPASPKTCRHRDR